MPLDVLGKSIEPSSPSPSTLLTRGRPHARYTDRANEYITLAGRPG